MAKGKAKKKSGLTSRVKQDGRKRAAVAAAKSAGKVATQEFDEKVGKGTAVLTLRTKTVRTLKDALAVCEADLSEYEVERWIANKWDMAAKLTINNPSDDDDHKERLAATELWQVKVWFKRKAPVQLGIEKLLDEMGKRSARIRLRRPRRKPKRRRALELSVMDPHLGLRCNIPQSDQTWDMDLCEQFYLFAFQDMFEQAQPFGPFEEIVVVVGNDFLHIDTPLGTTTRGTPQPEAEEFGTTLWRGEKLAVSSIAMILDWWQTPAVSDHATLEIKQVPGNHDHWSSYQMGRLLNAWFRNDQRVNVDADLCPFKMWRFGTSLIGFEHGHSIAPIRMAGLMANEWREHWAETHFHEWHLGDQHRRGSSKPCVFEEQGVSTEFLPGLVSPNQWHRQKSFNFQKRGAIGFIYDYDSGPRATVRTNISKYTGQFL